MKKINIILIISEEELNNDKNEISNFIRNLNDIYEDYNVYIRLITKQEELTDEDLKESDLFLILIQNNMSNESSINFELAYNKFKENFNPKISTYMKKSDNVNQTVINFMKHLDENLGHFYTNYENTDTIKLNLAMQLQSLGFEEGKFDVKEGKLIFDNKEIMTLENIPMFFNNSEISKLKEEYKKIEDEYWDLKEKRNQDPDNDNLLEKYLEIKNKKDSIMKNIQEIELSIINFEKSFIEDLGNGKLSKRQIYARKCLEEGNIEEAKSVLDFNEIKKDIEQVSKSDELNKNKISIMINELYQRIDILKMEVIINNDEIEQIYDEIIKNQKQYGLQRNGQYFYAEYLFNEGKIEEALKVIESYYYYLKSEDNNEIRANIYKLYADCLLENNMIEKALDSYINIINLYKNKSELVIYEFNNLFDVTFIVAKLYAVLKKFDMSIEYYLSCLYLNEQIYKNREKEKYNYLNLVLNYNLSYVYFKNSEKENSHNRLLKVVSLVEEYISMDNNYEKHFFELYRNIALLFKGLGSFNNSKLCYEKCIYILEQLSNSPLNMLEYIDYAFDHLDDEDKNIKFYAFDFELHYSDIHKKYELIGVPETIDKKEYYIERLKSIKKEYKELLEVINENN